MATRQSGPRFGKDADRVGQMGQRVGFVGHDANGIRAALEIRTTPQPVPVVALRKDALVEVVRDAMRQMQRSAVGLTHQEVQLVKDVGRGRYIGGVLKALEIGQKCESLADATALPEAFRGWQVTHHAAASSTVIDAFRGETDANGAANLAQFEFEISPTEANRQRAIEALNRQLAETHRALTALHKHKGIQRSA